MWDLDDTITKYNNVYFYTKINIYLEDDVTT